MRSTGAAGSGGSIRWSDYVEEGAESGEVKPTLYHGTCGKLIIRDSDGDELDRKDYEEYVGYDFPHFPRDKLIPRGSKAILCLDETRKKIYATPNPLLAAAYSLKTDDLDHKLSSLKCCIPIRKTGFCVFNNLNSLMLRHPSGRIFKVPNHSFTPQFGAKDVEWVSSEAVEDIELVKLTTPEYVMKLGVQIFVDVTNDYSNVIDRTFDRIYGIIEEEFNMRDPEDLKASELLLLNTFQELTKRGDLLHLNRELNLNPADLKTGLPEDTRYINDFNKIFAPSPDIETRSFSAVLEGEEVGSISKG